jgi:hypothetical protein
MPLSVGKIVQLQAFGAYESDSATTSHTRLGGGL